MRHTHRQELLCGTGVSRYDQSRDVNQSREVRLELGSATGVGIYHRSHIFSLESGKRLESHLPTGVGYMTEVTHKTRVMIYLHYKHV
jgi:glycine/serine hydroxymethyltransferase